MRRDLIIDTEIHRWVSREIEPRCGGHATHDYRMSPAIGHRDTYPDELPVCRYCGCVRHGDPATTYYYWADPADISVSL